MVAAAADADLRGTRSIFRTRGAVWLGQISYAFFLVHYLVLHFGHRLVDTRTAWDLLTCLLVTVGAAWLLHVAVERPCVRRWSRPALISA